MYSLHNRPLVGNNMTCALMCLCTGVIPTGIIGPVAGYVLEVIIILAVPVYMWCNYMGLIRL